MESAQVLVIGAGLAGLTVAQALTQQGVNVLCVDKARGSGGRLSSKRVTTPEADVSFDLGASSFTAVTSQFKQAVNAWCELGLVANWLPQDQQGQYVATPRSSSITRHLADNVGVEFGVRVTAISKEKNHWQVFCEGDRGERLFSQVAHIVLAIPAPQALALLPDNHALKPFLKDVNIYPQWVAMFALNRPLTIDNSLLQPNANITRISYENSKPERYLNSGLHVYCVQASRQWSEQHLMSSKDKVIYELAAQLAQLAPEPIDVKSDYAHRWLYAQGSDNGHVDAGYLTYSDGIHICGDYLLSDLQVEGVEAAYLSGRSLGQYLNQVVYKNSGMEKLI